MAIVKPQDMDFSNDHITMILYGLPGVGKTTLACSAPNPVIIDCDHGLKRVRPEHRKDGIMVKTFEELLEDAKSIDGYETVVIDTGGAFVDLLKDWAVRTEPAARKNNGGISQQGFGIVKERFLTFTAWLRQSHNVVYVFHAVKDNRGDNVFYELMCEGSAKSVVWLPADLGAYMQIVNGDRYLGFTPTDNYSAKAAYGIRGLCKVPELPEGTPNDYLTQLFARVREEIRKEAGTAAEEEAAYQQAMQEGRAVLDRLNGPGDVSGVKADLDKLAHARTSQKELTAALKARIKDLGIVYNKETRAYEQG